MTYEDNYGNSRTGSGQFSNGDLVSGGADAQSAADVGAHDDIFSAAEKLEAARRRNSPADSPGSVLPIYSTTQAPYVDGYDPRPSMPTQAVIYIAVSVFLLVLMFLVRPSELLMAKLPRFAMSPFSFDVPPSFTPKMVAEEQVLRPRTAALFKPDTPIDKIFKACGKPCIRVPDFAAFDRYRRYAISPATYEDDVCLTTLGEDNPGMRGGESIPVIRQFNRKSNSCDIVNWAEVRQNVAAHNNSFLVQNGPIAAYTLWLIGGLFWMRRYYPKAATKTDDD